MPTVIKESQLVFVYGGDKWCTEAADGSVQQMSARYYDDGIWRTDTVHCTEETTVTITERRTAESSNWPDCKLTLTPPFLSCTSGAPTSSTSRTATKEIVIRCAR